MGSMLKKTVILTVFLLTATGCLFAQSSDWALGPFERPKDVNPIITPNDTSTFYCPMRDTVVHWEAMSTFNPAAVVKDKKMYVLYRAEDKLGEMKIGGHTSRIGMAISDDGLSFKRLNTPVLYHRDDQQKKYEWPGGCEDPRLVETNDGRYVITYTEWNHKTPRLAIATSKNLTDWNKHGPAFEQAYDGKYNNMDTKSGAILTKREGDHLVAIQIDGKYWMYWGVPNIHLATSRDLIHWKPVENEKGKLKNVLSPRKGYFDSWLVEAGPPALLTDKGILVIYNAGNSGSEGDPAIPDSVYTGGQALFDARHPDKLLDRLGKPFIKPEKSYEKSGQYTSGTTFLEGLAHFNNQWFIYYGMADSRVGVVTSGTEE
ncbi:MAG TPA: glycoside hydrolase family 130 protein [Balneolaceae bacterium]|nr:glycoside hydrolase family 130 protein [Balneolaceae bacterium]